MDLDNNYLESFITHDYVRLIMFVLVCYLINLDVIMALVIFTIYFVISHFLEDKHIDSEIEKFNKINEMFL